MGGALSVLGLALAAVAVEGGSTCPRPADVAAELSKLVPPWVSGPSARVEQNGRALRIELRDASGALLGTRILQGSPRCSDLAAAGAVVIASWIAELQAAPQPTEEPVAAPVPLPARKPAGRAASFDLAAGAVGSFSRDFGLGALVAASLAPPGGSTAGQLSLAALGAHEVFLDPGRATWQRFSLGLGAHQRLRPGSWKVDLQAEALAALLAITGDENTTGVARTSFDPGASIGVRALSEPGLWVAAFAAFWFRAEEVTSPDPAASSAKLPQFEVFLAAGVAWGTE